MRVRTESLDRFLSSVGEVILTSRQVRTVAENEGLASSAEFATNGRFMISASIDGIAMIWELDWDWEFEDPVE